MFVENLYCTFCCPKDTKELKFLLRDMKKTSSGPCANDESCVEKMSNMAFSKTKERKSRTNLLLVDYLFSFSYLPPSTKESHFIPTRSSQISCKSVLYAEVKMLLYAAVAY